MAEDMWTADEMFIELWNNTINSCARPGLLARLAQCNSNVNTPFNDATLAARRLHDAGVDASDFERVARSIAYEAVFATLFAISELDAEGQEVGGLHESLLMSDPSGLEGCNGSFEHTRTRSAQ